jgi:hypothetical protein
MSTASSVVAGVTLMLLWEEYCDSNSDSFSYSWFCERYKEWAERLKPTLRQVHVAGDKLFVDYSGHTLEVIDGTTGEVRTEKIFVAVLGASNYTEASLSQSQSLPEWIASAHSPFRWHCPADGERQSQGRHHPGMLSRADGGQPHLSGPCPPLRQRHRSSAAASSARQVKVEAFKSSGDGFWRAFAIPLLLARRPQRDDPWLLVDLNNRPLDS